jgi:predicted amidohydrolase YtcJ
VFELRGKYVIPGLADMHNHLDSDSVGNWPPGATGCAAVSCRSRLQ